MKLRSTKQVYIQYPDIRENFEIGDAVEVNFTTDNLEDVDLGMSGIVLKSPYRSLYKEENYLYLGLVTNNKYWAVVEDRRRTCKLIAREDLKKSDHQFEYSRFS